MEPTVVKATATQFAGRMLLLEITSTAVRRPSARPAATATASQPTVPAPPAVRCSQPVIASKCADGAGSTIQSVTSRFAVLDRSATTMAARPRTKGAPVYQLSVTNNSPYGIGFLGGNQVIPNGGGQWKSDNNLGNVTLTVPTRGP